MRIKQLIMTTHNFLICHIEVITMVSKKVERRGIESDFNQMRKRLIGLKLYQNFKRETCPQSYKTKRLNMWEEVSHTQKERLKPKQRVLNGDRRVNNLGLQ